MGNLGNDIYGNNFYGIDTSRENMNRILNPSTRYYPKAGYNRIKPITQEQEKAAAGSFEERRQSDMGSGVVAVEASNMAGAHMSGLGGRAEVPAGTKVSDNNKHESCAAESGFKLDFSNKSLLNGIILAEVLGKPKYFRKGRW